jgi:hypothetical protein
VIIGYCQNVASVIAIPLVVLLRLKRPIIASNSTAFFAIGVRKHVCTLYATTALYQLQIKIKAKEISKLHRKNLSLKKKR